MFPNRPLLLTLLLLAPALPAQTAITITPDTRAAVQRLVGDILVSGQAYDFDRQLADGIGPRLTGSANYARGVAWATEQFKAIGLKNIHTEPFALPSSWEPETLATGKILEPREQNLHLYSAGWSPSTPSGGIKGKVIYLAKILPLAELDAQKDKIAGNIVFFDDHSFGAEPEVADLLKALTRLNELHAKAVLMPGNANGTENAGSLTFAGIVANQPVAQIGLEDGLLLKRLLDKGPVTIEFAFKNRLTPNVEVQDVVAEIPGQLPGQLSDPSSIVIVGAHLDSWHPGTGAQDNGTGVATVLEVARAIQALGRPPRRTVRFLLFGGEEQGLMGSSAYVKHHLADLPAIDAVLISDTGSQPAKGWYVMGREDEKPALANLEPLLAGLGSGGTSANTAFFFETDHAAFDVLGVPTLVLWNSTDKYFKLHHQASDTFDAVVQSDLTQGVATTAATAYAIADAPEPFAPHLTPAQITAMLTAAKQLDSYTYFKTLGWVQ